MANEFSDKYKPLIEKGYITRDVACALTSYEGATGDTITFDEKAIVDSSSDVPMKSTAEGREMKPDRIGLRDGTSGLGMLHVYRRPGSKDPHLWLIPDHELPVREYKKEGGASDDSWIGKVILQLTPEGEIAHAFKVTGFDAKEGKHTTEPVKDYQPSELAKKLAKHARPCPTPMM